MKTKKLIFLFSILFSMLVTNASAKDNYDIALKNADGVMIYYAYNNKETEVVVTYKTDSHNSYSGSVVIPKEITYNKKRLKVTGIASEAFKDCSNLKSVTIPDCVKCINFYAFEGCSKLQKVTSKIAKPFVINGQTFSPTTYSNATLYMPKGTVAKYKATNSWKKFKNIVEEGTKTGIEDVATQANEDAVTIRTEGKQLTVEGTTDNTVVAVYALDGARIGSAISKNGIAVVNTNVTNSMVIVRVGNKSKKMLIR